MMELKLVQLNAENLFLDLDLYKGENLKSLTEGQWQSLSASHNGHKPLLKTRWLAEALQDMQADIIFLIEVGGWNSAQNFNRYFLDDRYEVLMAEGNSNRGIDLAYLVRRDLNFSTMLLSHKHRFLDFRYPKEALGVRHSFSRDVLELRILNSDTLCPHMTIFNVHFKSKLDPDNIDAKGRARRKAEVNEFCKILAETRNELGIEHPIIVGGDFNGTHTPHSMAEPEFAKLYEETDLIELFEVCGAPINRRATQIQFMHGYKPVLLQLDGFWMSPGVEPLIIKDQCGVYLYKGDLGVEIPYTMAPSQKAAMPSDHYPVRLTLAWPPRS